MSKVANSFLLVVEIVFLFFCFVVIVVVLMSSQLLLKADIYDSGGSSGKSPTIVWVETWTL